MHELLNFADHWNRRQVYTEWHRADIILYLYINWKILIDITCVGLTSARPNYFSYHGDIRVPVHYNGTPFVYMCYTYCAFPLYLYTYTCTCICTCIMCKGKLTRALWSMHALHLQLGRTLLTTFTYTDKASCVNEHKTLHAFMHSGHSWWVWLRWPTKMHYLWCL